ncbi:DUF4328 domain-containing protein [Lentzea sp.]|uniref:DUF4328 domain-containing protein n=1 Tax=Lentzea sp. TaxID=56099 RepID=UPI002ED0BA81
MRGVGLAASVLLGLAALGNVAEAAADWLTYTTVRDFRAGTATRADLGTLSAVRSFTDLPFTMITVAAVVVFVVWTYRARVNAERLAPAGEHRLARVWAGLGWFVPVVSLWFPKVVLDDVWRASDPESHGLPLQERPHPVLVTRWWITYLLTWFLDLVYFTYYDNGELSTGSFLTAAVVTTMCAGVGIVSAVLAVQVVRRISDFQSTPLSPLRTEPAPG